MDTGVGRLCSAEHNPVMGMAICKAVAWLACATGYDREPAIIRGPSVGARFLDIKCRFTD